ncbi:MAG: hypothetical protein VX278_15555, partial [Myxococcota bacterium]|nr:hypothetical protein [Myxococcota bacterium]
LIPGLNYTNIFLSLYVAVLASIVASAVAIATGWLLPHPLMNTILSLVVLMFFMSVAGTLLSISV